MKSDASQSDEPSPTVAIQMILVGLHVLILVPVALLNDVLYNTVGNEKPIVIHGRL